MQAIKGDADIRVKDIEKKKEEIMQLDDNMRRAHIERIGKKKCSAAMTSAFSNLLLDIDRMGNSCVNLVEIAVKKNNIQEMG